MIKNILFDLGGVFVRLTREESIRRFEELGIHDADQMLDPYCQSGLFLDLESGRYTADTFVEELNRQYGTELTVDDVSYAIRGFVVDVQDYKFDYIANELPSDIRLLLVSNTNEYVHSWANTSKFLKSGRLLESFFDRCYISYKIGICKPDRRIFDHIIADAEIRPEETLFVDDGPANVRLARELGFVTYRPDNGEDWRPVLNKMLR